MTWSPWAAAYTFLSEHKNLNPSPEPGRDWLLRIATRKVIRKTDKAKEMKSKLPAWVDALTQKQTLLRACEELCKAIVKRRDLNRYGMGHCISCGAYSAKLQWGHYVEQHKSDWLQFDPRDSAMQCGACNGPGKGMREEFAKALDAREGVPGFAAGLDLEAKRYKTYKHTVTNLLERKEALKATLEKMPRSAA